MSSLTPNLKLVKPELQDNITPTIFADNFDKIDAALEGVSGGALSLEEIEASTNLDGKIPSAAALKEVNNSLGGFSFKTTSGKKQVSTDGGKTWSNFSSGAELLWTNPAPNNSFPAQTLSIDLSNYESIVISCIDNSENFETTSTIISKAKGGHAMAYNSTWAFYRNVTITDTSITFGIGHGNNGDNASRCIPTKIYGVAFSI